MASTGQRVVQQPGGQQVLVARPQGAQQGQQIVRTSSGQLLQVGGQQVVQQRPPGGVQQQQVIRQATAPGAQITVPLSTLQALQAGQGIPTGQPGHLLVKTETGQYQILRVGPPGAGGTTTASPVTVQPSPQQPSNVTAAVQPAQQQQPQFATPNSAAASAVRQQPPGPPGTMRPQQPTARLPTQPLARPATASPQPNAAAAASLSNNSMGQQMTPDTAKI